MRRRGAEEGQENIPERGTDANKKSEVEQPKDDSLGSRKPAVPEQRDCAGREDMDCPFST